MSPSGDVGWWYDRERRTIVLLPRDHTAGRHAAAVAKSDVSDYQPRHARPDLPGGVVSTPRYVPADEVDTVEVELSPRRTARPRGRDPRLDETVQRLRIVKDPAPEQGWHHPAAPESTPGRWWVRHLWVFAVGLALTMAGLTLAWYGSPDRIVFWGLVTYAGLVAMCCAAMLWYYQWIDRRTP
jgi:hypothetical protein